MADQYLVGDDTICIDYEHGGSELFGGSNTVGFCYSDNHVYKDDGTCKIVPGEDAKALFLKLLAETQKVSVTDQVSNPFDCFVEQCPSVAFPYEEIIYQAPKPFWHELQEKSILALELVTIGAAASVVSPYLTFTMAGSAILAIASVAISHYYEDSSDNVDPILSFIGDISQATMKHIAFYEIATCSKYKDSYRSMITDRAGNIYAKNFFDIGYFMIGNTASNWISYSLTDLYNKLIFDEGSAELRVDQESFTIKGPKTAYKRLVKEVAKMSVMFIPLKFHGDVERFDDMIEMRLSQEDFGDDHRLKSAEEFMDVIDDTQIPSLLSHFSANVQVSTFYNGFSLYNTFVTLAESAAKYSPEIAIVVLEKYLGQKAFPGGRADKYFRIFMCTTAYNGFKVAARQLL